MTPPETTDDDFDWCGEEDQIRRERKSSPGAQCMTLVAEIHLRFEKWERSRMLREIAALKVENAKLRERVGAVMID